ncbi:MAG: MBOAT family protein [Nitrospirae bacterium]|nr:MBOAT family protein [Nitrospirota bacterium]
MYESFSSLTALQQISFNSYGFIFLFLPVTLTLYFYLNYKRLLLAGKVWILLANLLFYSLWNIYYVPLILFSVFLNYRVGIALSNEGNNRKNRKLLLLFGIVTNIALLGYFKYADFIISNINVFFGARLDLLQIALPMGISFFTFTQIAYLVDAYRGEVTERSFLDFTVFITFFPRLLAGPIIHHREMLPQFNNLRAKLLDYKHISSGIFLFSIGLVKKVILADTFATYANPGFDSSVQLPFFYAWITSLSYTLQIYFDFSGYTDMALGIAMMFNIRLPFNFNSPYQAINIQDFWRRWHITLTSFLRDQIYIPLGGNRTSNFRTYINFITVFLIGGLWHGASWMFVIWGAMHGIAMTVHRIWQKAGFEINRVLAWLITFIFINYTWVFFRANKWEDAVRVLKGMTGMSGFEKVSMDNKFFFLVVVSIIVLCSSKNSNELVISYKPNFRTQIIVSFLLILGIIHLSKSSTFVYVNF